MGVLMALVACAVVFMWVSVSGGSEEDLEGGQSGGGGGLPKRTALNAAHSALLTLTTVGYVVSGGGWVGVGGLVCV